MNAPALRAASSDAATASLTVRAPSEPPTTSTTGLSEGTPSSLHASLRLMAAASVMAERTGVARKQYLAGWEETFHSGYAVHMASALAASSLLVTPAYEFCSCMRVGMPCFCASLSIGPLAYPPTPTAMSGRNSRNIFCHTHRAPQAHEHAEIAPQALAVESAYGESDNLISGSRDALHLHASFGSDKQYLDVGHPPAQCIGY